VGFRPLGREETRAMKVVMSGGGGGGGGGCTNVPTRGSHGEHREADEARVWGAMIFIIMLHFLEIKYVEGIITKHVFYIML
jgi:hypothetical protein